LFGSGYAGLGKDKNKMTEYNSENKRSLRRKTLVSLWHTWIWYDYRALCVTDEAIHLIYLRKPNPLLLILGPIAAIIMQLQARSAYKRVAGTSIARLINSHPKNITLTKNDITRVQGSSRRIVIKLKMGRKIKLVRMGDGDLMTMVSDF